MIRSATIAAVVAFAAAPTAVFAQTAPAPNAHPWTVSVNGGGTAASAGAEQRFVSVAIARRVGDAVQIEAAATIVDSPKAAGAVGALPARTYQIALTTSYDVGRLSLEGQAHWGQRVFSSAAYTRANGVALTLDGNGTVGGGGLAATRDFALAGNWYLSPSATIDYDRADIARALRRTNGKVLGNREVQQGVTGGGGLAVQRLFGRGLNNGAALSATFLATSNTAAHQSSGRTSTGPLGQPGRSDTWVEIGASTSIGLTHDLDLTLAGLQTIGFANGDAATFVLGLKFAF